MQILHYGFLLVPHFVSWQERVMIKHISFTLTTFYFWGSSFECQKYLPCSVVSLWLILHCQQFVVLSGNNSIFGITTSPKYILTPKILITLMIVGMILAPIYSLFVLCQMCYFKCFIDIDHSIFQTPILWILDHEKYFFYLYLLTYNRSLYLSCCLLLLQLTCLAVYFLGAV